MGCLVASVIETRCVSPADASDHRPARQGQHERVVERVRRPAQAARIPSFDRDAAFAGDQHPADAQSASLDRLDDAKLPQARERSWVDRVSAQLVARKRCAIDDAHAGAGAREHQAGNRAGRTRTHNKDIMHWVIGESGNRVID